MTEGFCGDEVEKSGFMRSASELEPLHHLTVVPEGCKATFSPYSGEARVSAGHRFAKFQFIE
jgi:hypothetical protein